MALLRVKEALQKCSEGIFDQYNFGDFTNVDISFSVQYLATKYDPEVAALYKEYLQSFQTTEDTDTSMAIPGLTRDASGLQDSTAVVLGEKAMENTIATAMPLAQTNG